MSLMFHGVLILTMLSFCTASRPPNTIYKMRVYVTNAIEDSSIVVHVTSADGKDQGNRTLAFNEEFDWKFGVIIGTYYKGEFWWGSKYKSISLFNYAISGECDNGDIFRVQRCFWLVKPDGFYYHGRNETFPGHWTRWATW